MSPNAIKDDSHCIMNAEEHRLKHGIDHMPLVAFYLFPKGFHSLFPETMPSMSEKEMPGAFMTPADYILELHPFLFATSKACVQHIRLGKLCISWLLCKPHLPNLGCGMLDAPGAYGYLHIRYKVPCHSYISLAETLQPHQTVVQIDCIYCMYQSLAQQRQAAQAL